MRNKLLKAGGAGAAILILLALAQEARKEIMENRERITRLETIIGENHE